MDGAGPPSSQVPTPRHTKAAAEAETFPFQHVVHKKARSATGKSPIGREGTKPIDAENGPGFGGLRIFLQRREWKARAKRSGCARQHEVRRWQGDSLPYRGYQYFLLAGGMG